MVLKSLLPGGMEGGLLRNEIMYFTSSLLKCCCAIGKIYLKVVCMVSKLPE
jgi:hypothetical protein